MGNYRVIFQKNFLMLLITSLLIIQCFQTDFGIYFSLIVFLVECIKLIISCVDKLRKLKNWYDILLHVTFVIIFYQTIQIDVMSILALIQFLELQLKLIYKHKNKLKDSLYYLIANTFILVSLSSYTQINIYLPCVTTFLNFVTMLFVTIVIKKNASKSPQQFTHRETINERIVIDSNGQSNFRIIENRLSLDSPKFGLQSPKVIHNHSQCELLNLFPQGIALFKVSECHLQLEYSNNNMLKLLNIKDQEQILETIASISSQTQIDMNGKEDKLKTSSQENFKASISSFSTFQAIPIPKCPIKSQVRQQKRSNTNNQPRESIQLKRLSSQLSNNEVLLKKQESMQIMEESLIEREVRQMLKLLQNPEYMDQLNKSEQIIQENSIIQGYLQNGIDKKRSLEIRIYTAFINETKTIMFVIRDVTHRDYISQLQQYSQQKSQTLSFVSHEYRTPLNCIIAMLETGLDDEIRPASHTMVYRNDIVRKSKLPIRVSRYIKVALDNAKYLLNLSDDLLDLAQMKVGKFKTQMNRFNLHQLMENCLDLFQVMAEKKSIALLLNYDQQTPRFIYWDSNRLKQIMINLIGNAFKFTQEGSIIVRVMVQFSKLEISVTDTGLGISEEDQPKLFKAFGKGSSDEQKKLNSKGVGLGLLISNQILQNLNQDLQNGLKFKSQYKKGATFYFTINYRDPSEIQSLDSMEERNQESEQSLDLQPQDEQIHKVYVEKNSFVKRSTKAIMSIQILIVDDVQWNIEVLKLYLERCGIDQVDSAIDGQSAIDKCSKRWSVNQDFYKLIFMDLEMPRIDGFQTAQKILELSAQHKITPTIIACSGYDMKSQKQECLKHGMKEYLTKPIKFEELQNLLQQYL